MKKSLGLTLVFGILFSLAAFADGGTANRKVANISPDVDGDSAPANNCKWVSKRNVHKAEQVCTNDNESYTTQGGPGGQALVCCTGEPPIQMR